MVEKSHTAGERIAENKDGVLKLRIAKIATADKQAQRIEVRAV